MVSDALLLSSPNPTTRVEGCGGQMEISWGEEAVYCVHRVQLLICLEPKLSLPSPQGQGWKVLGPLIFQSLGPDVLSTSGRTEAEVLLPVPKQEPRGPDPVTLPPFPDMTFYQALVISE